MATLSVWRFDSPDGAGQAVATLEELAKKRLIVLHDAATVSWEQGAKKPKTRQLNHLAGAGALGGAFWGLLFGLLFFVPLLGLAIGAAAGALSGSLADVGIDDDFIKRARDEITPGTSALFVLSSGTVLDKVREAFSNQRPELLFTNMSEAQETALREAFAE
jgi:uncharacterized membrane protein